MTKLIAGLLIAAAIFAGWHFFLYWEKVKNQQEQVEKQKAAENVNPHQLPGMPYALEGPLETAQRQGAAGLTNFLRTYEQSLEDPRKAWIELDYAMALSRENPGEAKRIFAAIKQRVPETSPVYPRIKRLEKTFE